MVKVDWRILSHGLVAYRKTRGNLLIPYRKVKPTLSELKKRGYKLAIVSDAPRIKAWIRLVSMGIDDFFDAVITFDDTGKFKPNILPFQKALKELKAKPSEVLMIGDNIKRDIKGAKKMGMKTVFARYGNVKKISKKIKSNADFEINNISEILSILKNLEK
jgi:putative hydrolase of the HAD superfamily